MPEQSTPTLDAVDLRILELLQNDARLTTAALGREVSLSPSATAERITRLMSRGIINGFHASIDYAAIGFGITAVVRIRVERGRNPAFERAAKSRQEVIRMHHITGPDCYELTLVASSMPMLGDLTLWLSSFGETTTSVVYESPVERRTFIPPIS